MKIIKWAKEGLKSDNIHRRAIGGMIMVTFIMIITITLFAITLYPIIAWSKEYPLIWLAYLIGGAYAWASMTKDWS